MRTIGNICLVGANTARTKAYVQVMRKNGLRFSRAYILTLDREGMEREAAQYAPKETVDKYFYVNEPVLYTLEKTSTPIVFLDTENINDVDFGGIDEDYLVFSGAGGQILKKELFEKGKQFIHVHPGILPQFRGSTTIYYSMLKEKCCGASAIFMSPGIDEGKVIAQKAFPMPEKSVDVDHVYEPYTRAVVLVKALSEYVERGEFNAVRQAEEGANTYFIIHPVLKYIALNQ